MFKNIRFPPRVAGRTKYHYDVSLDWSTCQLSENATCGQGVRNRLLSCIRSDGKAVNMNYCEQVRVMINEYEQL